MDKTELMTPGRETTRPGVSKESAQNVSGSDHTTPIQHHPAILLVESHPADALLVQESLLDSGLCKDFKFEHADNLGNAVERLGRGDVQLVLLDLGLPDGGGLGAIETLRAVAPHVPVLLLSNARDDVLALAAIRHGVQDLLVKEDLSGPMLSRCLRYSLERHRYGQQVVQRSAMLWHAREKLQELHREKDEILTRVAQEMAAPLGVIHRLALTVIGGDKGEVTQGQRLQLGRILENTEDLGSMLAELVEATHAKAGDQAIKPRSFSIRDLAQEVVTTLRGTSMLQGGVLLSDIPAELPLVHADPHRVRHVLIELIRIVVPFSPPFGSIRLSAVSSKNGKLEVRISVETASGRLPNVDCDQIAGWSGPGERDLMDREGLGLSLYVCKQLVERLGGRIWSEVGPARGRRYSFSLPVVEEGKSTEEQDGSESEIVITP